MKTKFRFVTFLFITGYLSLLSNFTYAESSWQMYQHDPQHTGRSPYLGPAIDDSPIVDVFVQGQDGDYFNTPYIGPDNTVILSGKLNDSKGVYVYDPNGNQKWHYSDPASELEVLGLSDSIIIYASDTCRLKSIDYNGFIQWDVSLPCGVRHYPTLDDGILYFIAPVDSDSSALWAIDLQDASLLWTYEFSGTLDSGDYSPAVGHDGTIYFGHEDTLYAINPDSSEKWQRVFIADCEYYTCEPRVGTPTIGADGTIYVIVGEEKDFKNLQDSGRIAGLHAINPENPYQEKWPAKYSKSFNKSAPPVITPTGELFIAAGHLGASQWVAYLYGYDAAGETLVNYPVYVGYSHVGTTPIIDAQKNIYGVFGNTVKAFGINGQEKWSASIPSRSDQISMDRNGNIYIGGSESLYVLLPSINNSPPDPPESIGQFILDTNEVIPVGNTVEYSKIGIKAVVKDPDGDDVKLEVELRRLDEHESHFLERFTQDSELVADGNNATAIAYGLVNGDYHWRARAIDEHGFMSEWVDFGNNAQTASDFSVEIDYAPVVRFTYSPQYPDVNEPITFDASSSYDPDGGDIVSYQWDFGNGETVTLSSPQVNCSYNLASTYDIKLSAVDNEGTASEYVARIVICPNNLTDIIEHLINSTLETDSDLRLCMSETAIVADFFADKVNSTENELIAGTTFDFFKQWLLGGVEGKIFSSLSIAGPEYASYMSDELKAVIQTDGWIPYKIAYEGIEEWIKNRFVDLAGSYIDQLKDTDYSYYESFISGLSEDIQSRRNHIYQLKQEVLEQTSFPSDEDIARHKDDIEKRIYASSWLAHSLYPTKTKAVTTLGDISASGEEYLSIGLKLFMKTVEHYLKHATAYMGIPPQVSSALVKSVELNKTINDLKQESRLTVLSSGILADGYGEVDRIYRNCEQVLLNIRDNNLPPNIDGEIIEPIKNVEIGYFVESEKTDDYNTGFFYQSGGVDRFYYTDKLSKVTVVNTGEDSAVFKLFSIYDHAFSTGLLTHEIPFIAMASVELSPDEQKIVNVPYLTRGEGVDPEKRLIGFYLFAETDNGLYGLDYSNTIFNTTKIAINEPNVSNEALQVAADHAFPISSTIKCLNPKASLLKIHIRNPYDWPFEFKLKQAIPSDYEAVFVTHGQKDSNSILLTDKLPPKGSNVIYIAIKHLSVSSETCLQPAQLKIYDRINDNWLEFSSDELTVYPSCSAGIIPVGYELVEQRRISRTEFEYTLRLKAANMGCCDLKDVTMEIDDWFSFGSIDNSVSFDLLVAGSEAVSSDTFTVRMERSLPTEEEWITWDVLDYIPRPAADLNKDWGVDLRDLQIISENWLAEGIEQAGNFYPDNRIDFVDFALFAEDWLKQN